MEQADTKIGAEAEEKDEGQAQCDSSDVRQNVCGAA